MIGYKQEKPEIKLTYNFTSDEIKALSKLLRSKENELPDELQNLNQTLEQAIYSCFSLDEIKDFYS